MIRRVEACWQNLIFEVKTWSNSAPKKDVFFNAIFRNRHPVSTGALFSEGSGPKKVRKNEFFLGTFFVSLECMFWVSFLVTTWWFSTTHGFASVKLMFWKVQAMLSSCVRCLKSGKMRPANSFWSSRARVVYIFEEELNGFLTVNFTWYFVVKIRRFRDR